MQLAARRWIYAAIIYFCLAVFLGVFMGASGDHTLLPVHAHLNLLGWVSLALIGVIYHFFPQAAANRVASVQFWLHNASLPLMMVSLGLLLKGAHAIEPVVGLASLAMLLAVLLFTGNILWNRA